MASISTGSIFSANGYIKADNLQSRTRMTTVVPESVTIFDRKIKTRTSPSQSATFSVRSSSNSDPGPPVISFGDSHSSEGNNGTASTSRRSLRPIRRPGMGPARNLPSRPTPVANQTVKPVWQEYAELDKLRSAAGVEEDKEAEEETIEKSKFLELRKRLNTKLSEANAHNRHLRRELQSREAEIMNTKSKLAMAESRIKELSVIARELAMAPAKASTAKINGRYALSHMALHLEAVYETLKVNLADVEAMAVKELTVEWFGMAEDVKVMGSFDDWTAGVQMSPEITGTFTRFSATLRLRPGRYEVKFLVDGEWRLMPEWEQSGIGLTANNVLIVD